jgi:uncharacterized DUF497 family protein
VGRKLLRFSGQGPSIVFTSGRDSFETIDVSVRRELHFDWDGAKALSNERKHKVAFTLALTIFRDPRIQTLFDEEHSGAEERWIALGLATNGALLVVVHTWAEIDAANVQVRIISSRRANAAEEAAYKERL